MTSWIISAVSRTVASVPGRWVRWWAERSRSWRSIIRMVPVAGRVAAAAVVLNLVIGVLPLGFVVGTSVAIERVAAAGQPGTGGRWGGVLIAVVLAVAALLLQTVLSPFQAAFTELISRRVDGVCARRLMRAALADAPVAVLEQPDVLDTLGDARRGLVENFVTPGAAVAGLIALIARYVQLAGAVVIVAVASRPPSIASVRTVSGSRLHADCIQPGLPSSRLRKRRQVMGALSTFGASARLYLRMSASPSRLL
jgi:hypothetical protein